jgi:hypothetical protein
MLRLLSICQESKICMGYSGSWHFCGTARHGNEGGFPSATGHVHPRADWVLYEFTT